MYTSALLMYHTTWNNSHGSIQWRLCHFDNFLLLRWSKCQGTKHLQEEKKCTEGKNCSLEVQPHHTRNQQNTLKVDNSKQSALKIQSTPIRGNVLNDINIHLILFPQYKHFVTTLRLPKYQEDLFISCKTTGIHNPVNILWNCLGEGRRKERERRRKKRMLERGKGKDKRTGKGGRKGMKEGFQFFVKRCHLWTFS